MIKERIKLKSGAVENVATTEADAGHKAEPTKPLINKERSIWQELTSGRMGDEVGQKEENTVAQKLTC